MSDKEFVTFSQGAGPGSSNEQTVYINLTEHFGLTDRNAKITLSSGKNIVSIKITQTKVPEEFYRFRVSGADYYGYNTYGVQYQGNIFYVDIASAVPWKFESDIIRATTPDGKEIKAGLPGVHYHLQMELPVYEVHWNSDTGYQCAFIGTKDVKHLTVFYHTNGHDSWNNSKRVDYYKPTTGKPTDKNQVYNNEGIK